jgi:23S rRNA pseudouridine1911/1915/1917 synthase
MVPTVSEIPPATPIETQRSRSAPARIVIGKSLSGDRVDRAIAAATSLSRRRVRALLTAGEILHNGAPLRVLSRPVGAGDVVDFLCSAEELGPLPQAPLMPSLLLDDGWVVAADKPAGELSQPAEDDAETAFDERLLEALAWRDGRRPFLRLVHRLDRLTSGVLLFARVPQALQSLAKAWRDGQVERVYIASVEGRPSFYQEVVSHPIGRDRSHRWRFHIAADGRPATTDIRLIESAVPGSSVAICRLVTGRTHQVRVHLAAAGHPVLGDRLYGATQRDDAPRPLLHATVLAFPHPGTGERVAVTSSLPSDLLPFVPIGMTLSDLVRPPS